nr:hypothetical protein [uncultured Oscillibacter sp.]
MLTMASWVFSAWYMGSSEHFPFFDSSLCHPTPSGGAEPCFLVAFNQLLDSKDTLLEDCRLMQNHLTDCSTIDTELDDLLREIEVVTELTKRCIQENAQSAQSQKEYAERYNGCVARYETAKAQVDALQQQKETRLVQADVIGGFMFAFSEQSCELTEFNESLWIAMVQKATAYRDGRLVFTFQNGVEIEA